MAAKEKWEWPDVRDMALIIMCCTIGGLFACLLAANAIVWLGALDPLIKECVK